MAEATMRSLWLALIHSLSTAFRQRISLQLEIVARRHRFSMYERIPRLFTDIRKLWRTFSNRRRRVAPGIHPSNPPLTLSQERTYAITGAQSWSERTGIIEIAGKPHSDQTPAH